MIALPTLPNRSLRASKEREEVTSSFGGHGRVIRTNAQFESEYLEKVQRIIRTKPVNRGAAHAMKDDTTASTHELMYVFEHFEVGLYAGAWAEVVKPNLPWANDHFEERVSGQPLNPAPSEAWWPFARKNNSEHKDENAKFSHTYPERFWPYEAGDHERGNFGIRYPYGDLNDLVEILQRNSKSRQAYLPIWFPEDLTAANSGLRVPCSMGYHFVWCEECQALDCVYTMRSCDLVRFYRDDVYMAGLLLQWVGQMADIPVKTLVTQVANLHCFPGDVPMLEAQLPKEQPDKRSNYNFGALY